MKWIQFLLGIVAGICVSCAGESGSSPSAANDSLSASSQESKTDSVETDKTVSDSTVADSIFFELHSPAMNQKIPVLVLAPGDWKTSGRTYPVVYLLHGSEGSWRTFPRRMPVVKTMPVKYQCIFVMADDAPFSWYLDSPVDKNSQYETFFCSELPQAIDSLFPTQASRKGRALLGNSMGGHGAFFIAMRHPEKFAVAGSFSGVFDFAQSKFRSSYHLEKVLGPFESNVERWKQHTVLQEVENYHAARAEPVYFIFECGTEDSYFIESNRQLDKKMTEWQMPHEYAEKPGGHNYDYWRPAFERQVKAVVGHLKGGR